MRIELNDGSWLEGEVKLVPPLCCCPSCSCPDYLQINIGHYKINGSCEFYSTRGASQNTEEEALEQLAEDMQCWADRINSRFLNKI